MLFSSQNVHSDKVNYPHTHTQKKEKETRYTLSRFSVGVNISLTTHMGISLHWVIKITWASVLGWCSMLGDPITSTINFWL